MPPTTPPALPLSEVAYNRIRDDILSCRLPPGQKITERGLVADLGLSMASVRNAMTRLDQEGLLITRPRKGTIVAPLSLHSVDKLFDFWALLAPEIARTGIPAIADAQMSQLLDSSARLVAHVVVDDDEATRENLLDAIDAALQIFTLLADASGNPYLIAAHRRINGELSRIWRLVIQSEFEELGGRVGALADVVRFIEERDAESAVAFLRPHIEASRQRVMSTLARWPSVSMTAITVA
ncbi:GntR family transcriptional regulator [Streptomyces sp. AC495_CC817]|uniref:GntR family transcriptional regulator n=1 Tax=Streptomyces sp. AC495_CC817 TaxID=2823900 RepID=UPI001C27DACF|nr:GntR family transcriptional regulator [Streptomyces sp. AC495_CC817]